jgi:hypothetical protein
MRHNRWPSSRRANSAAGREQGDRPDADADEFLILAKRIPDRIKRRVVERPDAYRKLAQLDDQALDKVLREL